MIKLKDRIIDDYGNVIFDPDQLVNLIQSGYDVSDYILSDENEVDLNNDFKYNLDDNIKSLAFYKKPEISVEEYFSNKKNDFLIPQYYLDINLKEYLLEKCSQDFEIERVQYEYNLIKEREMIHFFKCIIYLVDEFRKNKILWGVGRGSSVSVYSLYLIGIHKVNSIKYNLDCHEFFK